MFDNLIDKVTFEKLKGLGFEVFCFEKKVGSIFRDYRKYYKMPNYEK